jgi:hypothetical protein
MRPQAGSGTYVGHRVIDCLGVVDDLSRYPCLEVRGRVDFGDGHKVGHLLGQRGLLDHGGSHRFDHGLGLHQTHREMSNRDFVK